MKREKLQVHTNTVEGFYSIFKRSMKGAYQHCGKQHLPLCGEVWLPVHNRVGNGVDDAERNALALRATTGKQLTYRCGACN